MFGEILKKNIWAYLNTFLNSQILGWTWVPRVQYYVHWSIWSIGRLRHVQAVAVAVVNPQFFVHSYHVVFHGENWCFPGILLTLLNKSLPRFLSSWIRICSYHLWYLRMRTMTFAESMGQLSSNGVMSAIKLPKNKPMPVRRRAACFMFLGTNLYGILRRQMVSEWLLEGACELVCWYVLCLCLYIYIYICVCVYVCIMNTYDCANRMYHMCIYVYIYIYIYM